MKQEIKEIEINGVKYVAADSVATPAKGAAGPLVIVRCTGAGVHVGELVARTDATVTLANARRLWQWAGANTLNEVATKGIGKGSKLSEPVTQIVLAAWHEVITVLAPAMPSLTASVW